MRAFLFIWMLMSTPVAAESKKEVIDLGTLEVQGKARGPEVNLIDSNQMGDEALSKLSRMELKKMESQLLRSSPVRTSIRRKGSEAQ